MKLLISIILGVVLMRKHGLLEMAITALIIFLLLLLLF